MKALHLTTPDTPATRRGPLASSVARYLFPPAAVGAALALRAALPSSLGREGSVVLLFAAALASGVFGGLAPGLLATGLACMAAAYAPAGVPLTRPQMRMFAIQGVLVSLLGEGFRLVRRRAQINDALRRRLEKQILEIGDDERRRIGHDLHDGLGQHLTGISLLSESMAQQVEAGRPVEPAQIETITRLVSEAVRWTRDLARNFAPVTLESDGFVAAMEELAATAGQLLKVRCEWNYEGGPLPINLSRSIHLYRIAQEAVSNSVKHGKAKHIAVSMDVSGDELTLVIIDDGSGLSEKTMANPGLGLRIMDYRARMVGAALTVERAAAAGGTRVTCRCRLTDRVEQRDPASSRLATLTYKGAE